MAGRANVPLCPPFLSLLAGRLQTKESTMIRITVISLFLALASNAAPAPADAEYWPKIRTLLQEAKTREGDEAAKKYLESLTPEQLLLAGRACGREIQNAIDAGKSRASEGVIAFGFFSEYYLRATNGLRTIDPILHEIRDKTQPPAWRSELIGMLLGRRWDAKLTNGQRQNAFDCLQEVLLDKSDSILVRAKIPLRLARALSAEFARCSEIARSDDKSQRDKILAKSLAKRIVTQIQNDLKLFRDTRTPLVLRQKLLAGIVAYYRARTPGSELAKDAILEGFTKYRDYPDALWPQFSLYAVEDLRVPNAGEILDDMTRATKDEAVVRALRNVKNLAEVRK
jgi:hypothetical protein